MTDHEPDHDAPRRVTPATDPLGDLIRGAGHRPAMPDAALDAVRDAARQAWSARLARTEALRARQARQRRRWTLAAGVIFALVGITWVLGFSWVSRVSSRGVLLVERALDATSVTSPNDDGAAPVLQAGDSLPLGSTLRTGPRGNAALRTEGGASVRLARDSRVVLTGPGVLTLDAGAVYIDTEAAGHWTGTSWTVETRFGTIQDIGTQFTVTLGDNHVAVAVREGAVDVLQGGQRHRADAGNGLRLGADGAVIREVVARHGPPWSWVLDGAPPFELEGRSLHQFLAWVAREAGWTLRYQDANLAREARAIEVRGSIDGVAPDDAVPLVVPTAGLEARVEDGILTITRP